jgi:hypothetical protein
MSIEAGLSTYMLQNAGIALYVSSRVYPERLPETTSEANTLMPCITYSLVSENDAQTHDNQNWYTARIQIDVWAASYKNAHDTADAVHSALQGYRGSWAGNTIGGVFRKRKNDLPAPDVKLHRVSMDYMINYS